MRLLIGATALLLVLPKIALQCLIAWHHGRKISIYVRECAGKDMQRIQHRTVLVANAPLADFDVWFLYLKGEFDLIGPKALDFPAAACLTREGRNRLKVSPGIITPFQVKRASGIAHKTESTVSIEFAQSANNSRRLQLLFTRIAQVMLRSKSKHKQLSSPKSLELFGLSLSNVTMMDSITRVMNSLNRERTFGAAATFSFVNADCVNQYTRDVQYKKILSRFDSVFADGIGVKMAARWQGLALSENVNGTDMFPLLCEQLEMNNTSVYLLGATPCVVAKVAKRLGTQYPGIRVAGYSDGYSYSERKNELKSLINQSKADLLLVAMGAPRQERWIDENIRELNIKAAMGVGGLFDFYSGEVPRAPVWLRELSLEWIWRLAVQPRNKAKRYLIGNPLFLLRVVLTPRAPSKPSRGAIL